jgi:putative serine protease PepD
MTSTQSSTKARGPRTWLVACAACAVVGGVIGGVIANAINSPSSSPSSGSPGSVTGTAQSTSSQSSSSCAVTPVADKVLPSVVMISAKGATSAGTGSGEVINSNGDILTNNHVIAPAVNGGSLTVSFTNGKTAPAKLVGRDPLTDVAVIRVTDTAGLTPIAIGSSSALVVGQPVVVLGAPLGLSSTVTSGIVSALDRTIQVPGEDSQAALLINAIQTDAAINPGNSGGALVNCDGQFVGIPSAGASVPTSSGESSGGSIGLGFAIPESLAIPLANEIISTGKVSHAYIGLQATPVAANAATVSGTAEGLLVNGIDPSGPAQAAGLAVGDLITSIDGQPAVSTDQIAELMLTKSPGDKVSVDYTRNGASRSASITLASMP